MYAIWIVLVILGRIPFFGLITIPLFLVFALGMFILWIIVVLKAANGQKFKIPIIGGLAESQASK
jgi:uncharacterized membrane protein